MTGVKLQLKGLKGGYLGEESWDFDDPAEEEAVEK
jgi:hypothetical protein